MDREELFEKLLEDCKVQTYNSLIELRDAARLLGGEAKLIGGNGKIFAFVPKK